MTTSEHTTITVPGAALTDDAFDNLDIDFEEREQAEKPVTEEARLWWFNGLPTDTDVSAIGWHIKAGINPYIDETMEGMGVQRYLVQHKKPDRDGNTDPKPYWRLRSCSLIIIAQRLQSPLEMNRTVDDRQGLAFAWGPVLDDAGNPAIYTKGKNQGKEKRGTVLKFRAFVHELYRHGYYEWFPFTITGFGSDDVLKALGDQYRVLEYYKSVRLAQGKNAIAPFYLFSVPLGPGQMKLVGEPPDNQGSIYPIISQVPATIDKEYLKKHIIPRELIDQLRDGLVTETVVWSIEESGKIAAGRGNQGSSLALPEGTHAPASEQISAPGAQPQDELVQQAQLTWIVRTRCGGDEQKVQKICRDFGVSSPNQLRMSHFRALVSQVQATSNGKR